MAKIGPIEIVWNRTGKSYRDLVRFLNLEKKSLTIDPKTNPSSQLGEYTSWVSSAVSLISDRVSILPYSFYKKDTDEEITSKNHYYNTFTKPFSNPNPYMSFRFIKQFCQIQLDLCGMAMIYKAKNLLGQTYELWPLNMNDFLRYDIDYSSNPLLPKITYWFSVLGNIFSFTVDELIILKYPHPKIPWIGASPIQLQALAVDTQKYIEIYERDFFANSARVDMVLATDEDLDEAKANFIKQSWLDKFRGKFHDIAVLDRGIKPYPLKFMNKDFEFLNLSKWTKEMVLGAYRVNAAKLGNTADGGSNRANMVQIDISFNTDCIQPRLTMWDEECTKSILDEFHGNIKVQHDNPIPRDRELDLKETRVYLAGAPCLTINEARKFYFKLGPVPDGDKIYIGSNFVPLDLVKKIADPKNKPKPPALNPTDPLRHENDPPNVSPDGSDSRDNNPTPGRSITNFESKLREELVTNINDFISNNELYTLETIKDHTQKLFISVGKFYSKVSSDIDFSYNEDGLKWIKSISDSVGKDLYDCLKTGLKNSDNLKGELDSNPRISKICNFIVRSSINYIKSTFADDNGFEKVWTVHSNECGHKGRLNSFVSKDGFEIGKTVLNFPGEVKNFSCDCDLQIRNSGGSVDG